MNFERNIDPHKALGVGNFGRRGLVYEEPWIKSKVMQYHVKTLAWALDAGYRLFEENISLFQFPASKSPNTDYHPEYIITAAPGEPTDYDSKYRKIEYSEIISRFWNLVNTNEKFRKMIRKRDTAMFSFLRLDIE